jgi:crotonobetainyl-CoA:carnitine CoA-transferase CaiB-like acyl-CoA transferase
MAMPFRHRRRGQTKIVATPVTLEGLSTGVRRDVPDLGEHSSEILAEAGLTPDDIASLRAAGAVGGS